VLPAVDSTHFVSSALEMFKQLTDKVPAYLKHTLSGTKYIFRFIFSAACYKFLYQPLFLISRHFCLLFSYASYPIACLDRPLGLQDVEASRISRKSARTGGKVVSPTHLPPLLLKRYA
jgi:hypothetical protein